MRKISSVKLAVFVLLLASAVFMCACLPFKPPKPSKSTIERAVREESGLDARLIRQIDDETYIFEDVSRGIEFEVLVRPEKVKIDASEGGYTGKYYYNILHDIAVYESYSKDVDQLLKKYNLTDIEKDSDFKCIEHIYLLVDKDLSDDRVEDINAFLRGLRDIAIKDIEAGHDFYSEMHKDFGYSVSIVRVDRSGEGDLMYDIKGNSAVDGWHLTADVEDSELDLRKMNDKHQRYTTPQAGGLSVVIRVYS